MNALARTSNRLLPDPSRTLTRLFVPGREALIHGESRALPVLERVMAMDDDAVVAALRRTMADYSTRHRDLRGLLEHNFGLVAHRLGEGVDVGRDRRALIGAYFTHEYALEAAALCNPSIVAHPDQAGVAAGELRFVMSLRAIGEGHLSSIEFRTGTIDAAARVRFDIAGGFLDAGRHRTAAFDRALLRAVLREAGEDDENTRFVWDALPARFEIHDLDRVLAALDRQQLTRRGAQGFIDKVRRAATCNYVVEFDTDVALSERVLWPHGPAEANGMEDARFVRFSDGGAATYFATYTAFDGSQVAPQLITTDDFATFNVSQLAGPAAKGKGLALFPRKIAGRYAALSRWDRENNAISFSDDARLWEEATTVQTPRRAWDLIQVGNCGSPIETPAGWLVLTHGVGPMREYALGATLLDLSDPRKLIAALSDPLLRPDESERVGYVPNVVYSCGALLHGDTLVLPYGCSDHSVRIATVRLPELLDRLSRAH